MLKPKKKIKLSRKEMRKDPLLESIYEAQSWIKMNQKLITQVLIGITAFLVLLFYMNSSSTRTQDQSSTLFGKALVLMESGDMDNAILQFENLVDEHDGSKEGIQALYFLGKQYFNNQDYIEAKSQLETYIRKESESLLLSNAYVMLSQISKAEDHYDQSVEYLEKAIQKSKIPNEKLNIQLMLAKLLIDNDKQDKGADIIKSILEQEDLSFKIKGAAEQLSGQISK